MDAGKDEGEDASAGLPLMVVELMFSSGEAKPANRNGKGRSGVGGECESVSGLS